MKFTSACLTFALFTALASSKLNEPHDVKAERRLASDGFFGGKFLQKEWGANRVVTRGDGPVLASTEGDEKSGFAYMNMNTTLGVFLRDVHGIPESGYGFILSMNAAMVVLFQFWVTRRIKGYAPMLVMAVGTLLYAVGFALYGFVATYALFLLAMVIITIGEMMIAPVSQAIVARFAPEDMRGRYMAIAGFSFGIPYMVGPLLAGVVLDNLQPALLWWAAGLVGMLSVLMYLRLHRRMGEALIGDGPLHSSSLDNEMPEKSTA